MRVLAVTVPFLLPEIPIVQDLPMFLQNKSLGGRARTHRRVRTPLDPNVTRLVM